VELPSLWDKEAGSDLQLELMFVANFGGIGIINPLLIIALGLE
jgi:hypothetical protein